MIPTILHQIWLQGADEIPPRYLPYRETWLQAHPDWQVELWDDARIIDLLVDRYPEHLALYTGYPNLVQRVDAAKYFILHALGGFYTDMDTECVRPLDDAVRRFELVLSAAGPRPDGRAPSLTMILATMGSFVTPPYINNGTIGSIPGHAFWPDVFAALHQSAARRWFHPHEMHISKSTGPAFLTAVFRRSRFAGDARALLADPLMFDPTTVLSPFAAAGDGDVATYAIHHYQFSWVKNGRRQRALQAMDRARGTIRRAPMRARFRVPRR
jgi:hypothetical protein